MVFSGVSLSKNRSVSLSYYAYIVPTYLDSYFLLCRGWWARPELGLVINFFCLQPFLFFFVLFSKLNKTYFLWINSIVKICYAFIKSIELDLRGNTLFINLENSSFLLPFLSFLKLHSKLLFLSLVDITVVDCLSLKKHSFGGRFQLTYTLLTHYFKSRIIVTSFLKEEEDVSSISELFKASVWLEREVWDMFGIFFVNHPDLRRILTDYGFDGFPNRKSVV